MTGLKYPGKRSNFLWVDTFPLLCISSPLRRYKNKAEMSHTHTCVLCRILPLKRTDFNFIWPYVRPVSGRWLRVEVGGTSNISEILTVSIFKEKRLRNGHFRCLRFSNFGGKFAD
jgi:hypothetical protein